MTNIINDSNKLTFVAIDIAKKSHDALIQFTNRHSVQMKVENSLQDYKRLWVECCKHGSTIRIGFEPTADYHRNIAYWFQQGGIMSSRLILIMRSCKGDALSDMG